LGQIDEGESVRAKNEFLKDVEYITPHEYQASIYEQIERQWFEGENYYGFGSIVFMPTGSGKTLIAIMLILRLFGLYNPLATSEGRVRVMT
jgi:replicative superfamily II helicase